MKYFTFNSDSYKKYYIYIHVPSGDAEDVAQGDSKPAQSKQEYKSVLGKGKKKRSDFKVDGLVYQVGNGVCVGLCILHH